MHVHIETIYIAMNLQLDHSAYTNKSTGIFLRKNEFSLIKIEVKLQI